MNPLLRRTRNFARDLKNTLFWDWGYGRNPLVRLANRAIYRDYEFIRKGTSRDYSMGIKALHSDRLFAALGEQLEGEVALGELQVDRGEYLDYLSAAAYPDYYKLGPYRYFFSEKSLEHFVSLKCLEFSSRDVLVDVASHISPFAGIVRRRFGAAAYKIDLNRPRVPDAAFIQCDGAALPFRAESVSKMTLHCSFEHFEGQADIQFIREAARVLKPNGRLCILPLYLSAASTIFTDPKSRASGIEWDRGAKVVRMPGYANRFGRFYSPGQFRERILANSQGLHTCLYYLPCVEEFFPDCYLRFAALFVKRPSDVKSTA